MNGTETIAAEPLLKAADVARILNISTQLVYRLLQRGEIAVVRINTAVRVRPTDLQAYIDRSRAGFPQN